MGTNIEGGYDKIVQQVAQATTAAPVALSEADVTALREGFSALATDMMKRFDALKAAGDTEGMRALLMQDSLGATMDQLVIAAEKGMVTLPEGQRAIDIISPAVAQYLQRGMRYSVQIEYAVGGKLYSAAALNEKSLPDWHEANLR